MSDGRASAASGKKEGDLVDSAASLGASITRAGVAMVTWPLYLLPPQARTEAIEATTELFNAVGALHLSFLRLAISGLGAATRGLSRGVGEPAAAAPRSAVRVPIEEAGR